MTMSESRQLAIMDRLDSALGESYKITSDEDFYEVVENSIRRIEMAVSRSQNDPGHDFSLVQRVEAIVKGVPA